MCCEACGTSYLREKDKCPGCTALRTSVEITTGVVFENAGDAPAVQPLPVAFEGKDNLVPVVQSHQQRDVLQRVTVNQPSGGPSPADDFLRTGERTAPGGHSWYSQGSEKSVPKQKRDAPPDVSRMVTLHHVQRPVSLQIKEQVQGAAKMMNPWAIMMCTSCGGLDCLLYTSDAADE